MNKYIVLNFIPTLVFSICSYTILNAQDSEKLKELEVRILEANLRKKSAEFDIQIAQNNLTRGNANMLPTVNGIVGDDVSYTTNRNKAANGTENINGFRLNNAISAGIQSEVIIFNGGRNQNLFDRYQLLLDGATLDNKILAQDLIYQLRGLYFQAIRQNQQINATTRALDYADERLQLATNKLDIGTGNKVEVIQAELDKNQFLAQLQTNNLILDNIYDQIRQLMSNQDNYPIRISDSLFAISALDKESLKQSMLTNNFDLLNLSLNNQLLINTVEDIKGQWKPELRGNLGYQFTRSDNGGGFFLVNMSNGFSGGLNLNIPIYDGKKIKTAITNAEIAHKQNLLDLDQRKIALQSLFDQYYRSFETSVSLAELQRQNVTNAAENIEIGLARFRVGVTDGFEFKQIQQSYIDTYFDYIDALYQAKINELELLRLAGRILND